MQIVVCFVMSYEKYSIIKSRNKYFALLRVRFYHFQERHLMVD